MNPSSLDIDLWLRRAKGSAVQRHKDMNRNRLGDELGETNKLFGSELTEDKGCSCRVNYKQYSRGHCVRFAEHLRKYYLCEATGHL